MIDLVAGLGIITSELDRGGVRYVIVGSMATARWGVPRTTLDIELVLILDPLGIDGVLAAMDRDDVYVPIDAARNALAHGGSFDVVHTTSGAKIDVFVAPPDDEFERSRLDRRVHADVFGHAAWIATAEDVILSKLRGRIESGSETQWRDCVEIAAVEELDRHYLWSWAPELGVVDDLAELLGNELPPTS